MNTGALNEIRTNRMSVYLHVPFCATRCGYCDFNTYTAEELVRDGVTTTRSTYIDQAIAELDMARSALGDHEVQVPTIFIGGGTPTLVEPAAIGRFLRRLRQHFDLRADAEITIEANPETLTPQLLAALRAEGVNRLSMGMQSAVPHVLAMLERTHRPERVAQGVADARAAGFEHISVDLIYGVPGESLDDWQATLDTALSMPVDHLSAYSLIVEPGTRFAAKVSRGEVHMPDDDETAAKYRMVDRACAAVGMQWYEVSNWSLPGGECQHNVAYWRSADWWGIGPGAHSHVGGVRWWNVKHPATYAAAVSRQEWPAEAHERLEPQQQAWEEIMLRLRLREGLPRTFVHASRGSEVQRFEEMGWLTSDQDALVLTLEGRLMADAIVRALVD